MAGEASGLKLLDFWASPFGQRCRIVLAEKDVEYEYSEENLWEKSELLLRSNPVHKTIPVLLHDGKPICESLLIVQYIDEIWPKKSPIIPSDPYARAQARFWADYIDKKVYANGNRLWRLKGEEREEAKKDFMETLKTLEAELGDKTYFGGEVLGLVDIALVPFTTWFFTYDRYGGFSIEQECRELVAWGRRCAALPSVAKSLHDPMKIYDFVGIARRWYGWSEKVSRLGSLNKLPLWRVFCVIVYLCLNILRVREFTLCSPSNNKNCFFFGNCFKHMSFGYSHINF